MSACVLVLALPPDRICVGPGARFGFHQAITDVQPPFVQRRLKAHRGGLPSGRPRVMGYSILRQHHATRG